MYMNPADLFKNDPQLFAYTIANMRGDFEDE